MKSSESITIMQLILLAITVTGLNNHAVLPSPLIITAGRDAWLAVLVTLLFILIWCCLLVFIHKQVNGEHLFKWLKKYSGSFISNIFVFMIMFYLIIMATVTLKEMLVWINVTFLPKTPQFLLAFIFMFLCWILAETCIRTISIVNVFLLFFIVVFGFFVAFANLKHKNFELLLPFLEHGYTPILKSILIQASGMVELILFLFLQHKAKKPIKYRHFAITAILLTGLTLGPLIGAIIEFGPVEASRQRFPAYEEWGLVSLGNFIEHLDFLSIYQWLSGAFIRISLLIFIIKELFPGEKSKKWFIPAAAVMIAALTLVPISDITYTQVLDSVILPAIVYFFLGISVFIALFIPLLKKWRSSNVVQK